MEAGVVQSGMTQSWKCRPKPQIVQNKDGKPGPCPTKCTTYYQSVHSSCYDSVQQCIAPDGKTYYTAILQRTKNHRDTGDWANIPVAVGRSPYLESGCDGTPGDPVCWNLEPPVHISDGGGPQDVYREHHI